MSHEYQDKKVGDDMRLDEVATVRTGAVTGRKKAEEGMRSSFRYKMLNLKCIAAEGYIDLAKNTRQKKNSNPNYLLKRAMY